MDTADAPGAAIFWDFTTCIGLGVPRSVVENGPAAAKPSVAESLQGALWPTWRSSRLDSACATSSRRSLAKVRSSERPRTRRLLHPRSQARAWSFAVSSDWLGQCRYFVSVGALGVWHPSSIWGEMQNAPSYTVCLTSRGPRASYARGHRERQCNARARTYAGAPVMTYARSYARIA